MSKSQWHGTEGLMKHSFIDFKFPPTNLFHPNVSVIQIKNLVWFCLENQSLSKCKTIKQPYIIVQLCAPTTMLQREWYFEIHQLGLQPHWKATLRKQNKVPPRKLETLQCRENGRLVCFSTASQNMSHPSSLTTKKIP